ncbi:MAG: hypothetical protein AB8B84_04955 [Granulosicoccus sp.]
MPLQLTEPDSTEVLPERKGARWLVTGGRVRVFSIALAAKTGTVACSAPGDVFPDLGSIILKSMPAGGLSGEKVIEPSASVHWYKGSAMVAAQ